MNKRIIITSLLLLSGGLYGMESDDRAGMYMCTSVDALADQMAVTATVTPLDMSYEIDTGNVAAIAAALDAGMNIDSYNPDGLNMLHFAAYMGKSEIVHLLLSRGANPWAPTRDGIISNIALELAQQRLNPYESNYDRTIALLQLGMQFQLPPYQG